jgi:hypothetical protein
MPSHAKLVCMQDPCEGGHTHTMAAIVRASPLVGAPHAQIRTKQPPDWTKISRGEYRISSRPPGVRRIEFKFKQIAVPRYKYGQLIGKRSKRISHRSAIGGKLHGNRLIGSPGRHGGVRRTSFLTRRGRSGCGSRRRSSGSGRRSSDSRRRRR